MKNENALSKLKSILAMAMPDQSVETLPHEWVKNGTPKLVAEAIGLLEAKAERYNAMLTEALESLKAAENRLSAVDAGSTAPFMWGLITADGAPFFDECCVGEEAVVQEVATTYNSMADAADYITPVKLFLGQGIPDLCAPKQGLTLLSAGAGKMASPVHQFAAEEHQEALPFNTGEPDSSTEDLDYDV